MACASLEERMNAPSQTPSSGRGRRVLVTVLIATTAAAVTAGVVLNERHHDGIVAQRMDSSAATGASMAAPVPERRVQWREPWKRPGALAEAASTSVHDKPEADATSSDPSLPAAADALRSVDGASGEPLTAF